MSDMAKGVFLPVITPFTGGKVDIDAYKKLIASDVDIVMLCTPPGYRPIHFEAAIEAHKHVFTEKPVATDPVGARRFLAAARYDDVLALSTRITRMGAARIDHAYELKRKADGILLATAETTIACVDRAGQIIAIPDCLQLPKE